MILFFCFFFSSRRRHTRWTGDWSSDVCSSDLDHLNLFGRRETVIYAQSERLEMTSGPLVTPAAGSIAGALARDPDLLAPIEGSVIELDRLVPALDAGRKGLITGKLLRARMAGTSLKLTSADGSQTVTIG